MNDYILYFSLTLGFSILFSMGGIGAAIALVPIFNVAGLRLAHALLKADPEHQVTVFLMADAVVAARSGQKTPDGYYNMERMLKRVVLGKNRVLLCGTCMDARGMTDDDMMKKAERSTMPELAALTLAADKVLVF